MKKRLISPVIGLLGFGIILLAFADLNGRWVTEITTPDGESIHATYNFKVDGDKLTGTAESAQSGVATIDSGKVTGDDFSFQLTVDGNVYPHTGKVFKDSCSMDIDFGNGQKVHATLRREIEPKPGSGQRR